MTNSISLSSLSDAELIELYPALLKELKGRGIIRTNNLIGELGEYLAASAYQNNPKLPKLQLNICRSLVMIIVLLRLRGNARPFAL